MKKWLGIQHPSKTINFFTSRGYLRQAHKANIDLGRVQHRNLGSIAQRPNYQIFKISKLPAGTEEIH